MKALLGISLRESHAPLVQSLAAFGFPDLEVQLMHVIESVLPDGGFPEVEDDHPLAQIYQVKQQQGVEALENAAKTARQIGLSASVILDRGDVATQLIRHADELEFDLIAVHADQKGVYGSLFFGSVAKGLLIGAKQSLLIHKGNQPLKPPLHILFATDHSPYSHRCAEVFSNWMPSGVSKVTVMTANESADWEAFPLGPDMPANLVIKEAWSVDRLEEANRQVASIFARRDIIAETLVVDGHPNTAIAQTMQTAGTDLLVTGAQGHGFFDRIRLGSKSFHQVVNEAYPVLVVREQSEGK